MYDIMNITHSDTKKEDPLMHFKTVFAMVLSVVLTFMLPTTVYAATNELTDLR